MTLPPDSAATDLFAPDDWRTLLDVSLTGIHLVRPVYAADGAEIVDFAIEYLNPAGQRMTGLAEQPGGTLLTYFPHAVATGIFQYYQRVFETGQQAAYEVNYQADGLDNYFKLAARRSGQRLVVSFTDTSDQDRTAVEQALRESQAREQQALAEAERQRAELQRTFAQAPVAMSLLRGPTFVVEWANARMGQLWGRSVEQVQGRPHFEALPDLAGQGIEQALADVLQTGQTRIFEELLVHIEQAQQSYHGYFNSTYQPVYDGSQHITGILCSAFDVTGQVLARRQVEQLNHALETRVQAHTHDAQTAQAHAEVQRQRLERLFQQAPAAICILSGPELVYELVNPVYQQFFPERQLLGKPLLEALPELVDHAAYYTMRQVFDTGETIWQQALHTPLARTEDGVLEDRYFNYIQQPRYDEQGRIDGVLVFGFEVTEQVQVRQQVERLNQELAAINEELTATNEELHESNTQLTRVNVDLDNFIYTASHDLRAPISNIEGLLYFLREELPVDLLQEEEVGATFTRMLDAVERFKRTIDHLTEVSKLQKEYAPATEAVLLAPVVENVWQDLAPLIQESGVRLLVDVRDAPPLFFSAKNLRSVVYNLLSNALKYRSPDRELQVELRARVQEGYLVLEVQDNGLGIDPAHLPKLFTMFQRFHDHVEGTGIGLFMVKRMIENADGRLEVHSQLGAGTTFLVYLPCAPHSNT